MSVPPEDTGKQAGADPNPAPNPNQADPNAAAAAARREERARRVAVERERDDLARRIAELEDKNREPEPTFTEDSFEDPKKFEEVLEKRLQRKLQEQEKKLREEQQMRDAKQTASGIRNSFKVFSDPEYGQDAEDMLSGRLQRFSGEITPEDYREICQEVAKKVERQKALDKHDPNKPGIEPPPPGGGPGGSQAVKTGDFSKLSPSERREAVMKRIEARQK